MTKSRIMKTAAAVTARPARAANVKASTTTAAPKCPTGSSGNLMALPMASVPSIRPGSTSDAIIQLFRSGKLPSSC